MCTIVAKYLKDKGWVLAKNRDQDYVSKTQFKDIIHNTVGEILVMYDDDISYQEGMNYYGKMAIITTSLTPQLSLETNKKDGDNIYKALQMKSQEDAANFLIKQKMTGFIFIATPKKLILIEAARLNDGIGDYKFKLKVIPPNNIIVRTNHGIELPWAGFQYGINENQDMWRKSSEMRMSMGEKLIKNSNTPEEMMNALATRVEKDLQMNIFRVENKPRQMRTIFQWAIVPSDNIAYVRPIQARMKVKVSRDKLRIEVLDNEIIKKIYDDRIKHFCRIKYLPGDETIQTIQTENYLLYDDYINEKIVDI
jgi:hypothetical protein